MAFQPEVNAELLIDGIAYRVAEHPAAPGMPYGQEGRQAVVYQLLAGGERRALKIFKPRYQVPGLVTLAERLAAFADLPGLAVCRRTVLTPRRHTALLRQYPDLTYAVLMPWISGPTWMEVLLEGRALTAEDSLQMARILTEILAGLEERGVAHCDLSGPNLLLPALTPTAAQHPPGIELVDVEQLYGPGLERPEMLPGGSPGYAHHTAPQGLWGTTADRFAGAVLLAEILGWCDAQVRAAAWGESYFDPAEMQGSEERARLLEAVLHERWGAAVAGLFARAWQSETLADCPTFGTWLVTLPEAVFAFPAVSAPAPVALSEGSPPPGSGLEEDGPNAGPLLTASGTLAPAEAARLAKLFDDGLTTYQRGEWTTARELLRAVVQQEPGYTRTGQSARMLLAEVEQRLMPPPPPRRRAWAIIGAGGFVLLCLLGLLTALVVPVGGPFHVFAFGLTPTSTATDTPLPTATPLPSASSTLLPTATPTPTEMPSATSTLTPLPSATSSLTAVPTDTPLSTATPVPLPTATRVPPTRAPTQHPPTPHPPMHTPSPAPTQPLPSVVPIPQQIAPQDGVVFARADQIVFRVASVTYPGTPFYNYEWDRSPDQNWMWSSGARTSFHFADVMNYGNINDAFYPGRSYRWRVQAFFVKNPDPRFAYAPESIPGTPTSGWSAWWGFTIKP